MLRKRALQRSTSSTLALAVIGNFANSQAKRVQICERNIAGDRQKHILKSLEKLLHTDSDDSLINESRTCVSMHITNTIINTSKLVGPSKDLIHSVSGQDGRFVRNLKSQ